MKEISIKFEVLNPKEVVGKKKGKWVKLFASVFMNELKLKQKVEEQVCSEIVNSLKENLTSSLKNEGVEANVSISIVNKDETIV